MAYIDDNFFEWEHIEAQRILNAVTEAYREKSEVKFLIQRVKGLDDIDFNWDTSVKLIWKAVLPAASKGGSLRPLIELMISDSKISSFHSSLRELLLLPGITQREYKQRETLLPDALAQLLDIIRQNKLESNISETLLRAAVAYRPATITAYRIHRIAYLLQKRFAVNKRFVSLTLTYSYRDAIKPKEFNDLNEVLSLLPNDPAFVLLGEPGAGKSTLLKRLERDLNESMLKESSETKAPLPFYVSLNRYIPFKNSQARSSSIEIEWLASEWKDHFPKMPPLLEIMEICPVLFLLDGLNEMPYKNRSEQTAMLREWRNAIHNFETSDHRLIFSCRNWDYTSLSHPELTVPQIQIHPLSPEKISTFLEAYEPKFAALIWEKIKNSPSLLGLLNTPFFLNLLIEQKTENIDIPNGRAELISGFVKKTLWREVSLGNWPFRPGELLSQKECDSILKSRIREKRLPLHVFPIGNFIKHLSILAYEMQAGILRLDSGQVRIELEEAKQIINDPNAELFLTAGVSLGVIEEDFEDVESIDYHETVAFKHQLFQEYFAARKLVELDVEVIARLVRTSWHINTVEEPLETVISALPIDEPLPNLPQTGWEETVVLFSAMISQPDDFLLSLMNENLPLAGRCAAQPDVRASNKLKQKIRELLIERTRDNSADLRHRINAGFALGDLGDPRFELHKGKYGNYLLPPLVLVPDGLYKIGSESKEADEDEKNGPVVHLDEFKIGQFPVTNAEWNLFMKAGGYEEKQWWFTEEAQNWWIGEDTARETKKRLRQERNWLIENQKILEMIREVPPEVLEICKTIAKMDDSQFEAALEQRFPPNRFRRPRHWTNSLFNNPAQPVVGVCLYEVQAYCSWLSAQTNQIYRVPTEFEWEAAARGVEGRIYAYGNQYDPMRCNVINTHIGRTTPVGIFPDGDTPDGVSDMMGNCWEWTFSSYVPYAELENSEVVVNLSRVVRRGSSYNGGNNIRSSSRYWNSPNRRNDYLGFRLVCSIS